MIEVSSLRYMKCFKQEELSDWLASYPIKWLRPDGLFYATQCNRCHMVTRAVYRYAFSV